MNESPVIAPLPPAGELAALVRLLDDRDAVVGSAVTKRLLVHGADAIPHLLPLLEASDELLRSRVEGVIDAIATDRSLSEFEALRDRHDDPFNLESGCVALARVLYPEYSDAEFGDALDRFARTLARRIEHCATDGERVLTMTRFFFAEELFAGNTDDYFHPDNSFVNRVIDTRRGIPISLAVIILLSARRNHLPVIPVNMPAHFLLRYRTARFDAFIDPFYGRLLSREECTAIAGRSGIDLEAALIEPSDLEILMRMINNAVYAFDRKGDVLHARVLRKCLDAITPRDTEE